MVVALLGISLLFSVLSTSFMVTVVSGACLLLIDCVCCLLEALTSLLTGSMLGGSILNTVLRLALDSVLVIGGLSEHVNSMHCSKNSSMLMRRMGLRSSNRLSRSNVGFESVI